MEGSFEGQKQRKRQIQAVEWAVSNNRMECRWRDKHFRGLQKGKKWPLGEAEQP